MKISIVRTITFCLALSPVLTSAAELEDIDLSAVPNMFSNGAAADADEVNANFEYIRNNLDVLVALLKEQKTLSSDADRFTGTYTVTGIELNTDCSTGAVAITHTGLFGSATSNGSQMDFSLTKTGSDPIIRENQGAFEVVARGSEGSDEFSLQIDANGKFQEVLAGAMSADGNSFTLGGGESGCPGNVTYISGVRN